MMAQAATASRHVVIATGDQGNFRITLDFRMQEEGLEVIRYRMEADTPTAPPSLSLNWKTRIPSLGEAGCRLSPHHSGVISFPSVNKNKEAMSNDQLHRHS
ncbi:hypothetical protein BG53_09190 [Paenibacillus darwinianus]|uniref:Uncharacterized protein n=1 Tax=Paenibacillus darwinianus TaxID=1380763 RepID=A0A9W5RZG6_9BACL|nr:hypothetical protein [Paenibacillus darwinianus]EXX85214.1 hypothetical protein BG53_09190 [Paenibacillus darwinianus]EXX85273.1 hypothetical protein CH50_09840 [Paenibacillus darwinianus]EXX85463.1 hypothetical protein BG52_08455 [Paenibacillus darwinianus]